MFTSMSSMVVSSSLDFSSNPKSPNGIFTAAVLPLRVRGPWLVNDVEFQAEFLEVARSVL